MSSRKRPKVVDAYPPQTPGKRPICEGKLSAVVIEGNEARERYHGKTDIWKSKRRARLQLALDRCDNFARYRIGEQWLCRKHAAYALLDSLAERENT